MNWYLAVLKKYADFDGRARRKEYWMFSLISGIITMIPYSYLISVIIDNPDAGLSGDATTAMSFMGFYSLAVFIPTLAVTVRRLHDTNRSGWAIFWGLIPLIGSFMVLYFLVSDSHSGPNQYGENPKDQEDFQIYEN
jgi:uncharacterized membrane protein YhaH (DUF805 family)